MTGKELKLSLVQHCRKPSELADYLGVGRSCLSHWFGGQPIPRKYFERIALFFTEEIPFENALNNINKTDARSIYEIILPMTKDQKINIIQFILGTL